MLRGALSKRVLGICCLAAAAAVAAMAVTAQHMGSVSAPGPAVGKAAVGQGAPAAVVALLVASVVVVAAVPVATPEGTGFFSQIGLSSLGVSSVPGKKPPTSGILLPPYPGTHLPETLQGARQAISGETEVV